MKEGEKVRESATAVLSSKVVTSARKSVHEVYTEPPFTVKVVDTGKCPLCHIDVAQAKGDGFVYLSRCGVVLPSKCEILHVGAQVGIEVGPDGRNHYPVPRNAPPLAMSCEDYPLRPPMEPKKNGL